MYVQSQGQRINALRLSRMTVHPMKYNCLLVQKFCIENFLLPIQNFFTGILPSEVTKKWFIY